MQAQARYWFDCLAQVNVFDDYKWLLDTKIAANKIVNFGCWSGVEPLVLLWMFDADCVTVVEKEEDNLRWFDDKKQWVAERCRIKIADDAIIPIVADMTGEVSELPNAGFDLAYCEKVLYYMQDDERLLKKAIEQMVRVVKPFGYIFAREPSFKKPDILERIFQTQPVLKVMDGIKESTFCYQKAGQEKLRRASTS